MIYSQNKRQNNICSNNIHAHQQQMLQSPLKSNKNNECSPSVNQQGMFEAIITLKILANESGKELWKDVCLTTERDSIGKMVKTVQDKFTPVEYLNKNLKLRNVTIFSERFGLEVSVAVDGLATDGAKYTANFLNCQDLTEHNDEQRSPINPDHLKRLEEKIKSFADIEQKYKKKMDLLMKTERDLLEANKQKKTALNDLKLITEKNSKEKMEASKEAQNALDKVREESKLLMGDVAKLEALKKNLDVDVKAMREKSAKKTKEIEKLNKDLEKLERKRKGMLHQMDVYKKELDAELDGMNKLTATKEKTNKEIENLKIEKQKCKNSVDSMKKCEEECRKRLESLQGEEKNFYIMLNELKEQVQVHKTQLQELQGREEKSENNKFGQNFGQNIDFGTNFENFNNQHCQPKFDGSSGEQRPANIQCNYFNDNEDPWKRATSSFIKDKTLIKGQERAVFDYNNGSRSRPDSSLSTLSPDVKRERREEIEKFTGEDQSAPSSSHFGQNLIQNRTVYIGNKGVGNPEEEEFSYVDKGPIFGHQNDMMSKLWQEEQHPPPMNGPPQMNSNSIQPLNSVLANSVNEHHHQAVYSFNSSNSGQFRRGKSKRYRGGDGGCFNKINNNLPVRNYGNYNNNTNEENLYVLVNQHKGRKMRREERGTPQHKNVSKRFNISPIRGTIPSTSTSKIYGNRPHSVESSIMKRITIEDQQSNLKCPLPIRSRLSFERQ